MEKDKFNILEAYKINASSLEKVSFTNDRYIAEFIYDNTKDPEDAYPISFDAIIQDIFANNKSIYILLSDKGGKSSHPILKDLDGNIMLGCMLKVDYNILEDISGTSPSGLKLNLSNAKILGMRKGHPDKKDKIPTDEYYAEHFYNPIKFVGFDGKNLYIADDGKKYERNATAVSFKENVNRLVKFNLESESLSFEDSDSTWLEEE